MQMPDILSDPASVSGRSGGGASGKGAEGSGFGDLHQRLLSSSSGSDGLQPGDTLRNADGNVVGRVVRGEGGDLRLALEGREGQGIPLKELASLVDEQQGNGLETLQALFAGELEFGNGADSAGAEWLQQLENLTDEEQQGVLTALAGLNGVRGSAEGGNRLPLFELLGQGSGLGGENGSVRNSTSNFLQNLLSGMTLSGQNAQQGELGLGGEGFRMMAVEAGGGPESGSRGNDVPGLTPQTFTRGEGGREAMLRQYTTTVETPVQQQKQWSEQVAGKIAWIAGRSIQSADIQLNPPDMGPIDVRVSVQNDQAQVTVNAQNAQVREMLEANSSRLRDMLEQEGLSLADFDVSDDAPDGGGEDTADETTAANGDVGSTGDGNDPEASGELTISLDDSIDTYA